MMRSFFRRSLIGLSLFATLVSTASAGSVATFDDLPLAPNSYFKGPVSGGQVVDGPYGPVTVGTFASAGVRFANQYDNTYGSWSGFAYSNATDTTTPGYTNQYSAIAGVGHNNSANYGVAFGYDDVQPNLFDPTPFDPSNKDDLESLPHFTLPTGAVLDGMYVTNTTYAALSMLLGDGFSKKFGGVSGDDPDWFKLSAYGTDAAGNVLSNSVDFYLADYRFSDNSKDYVVTNWTYMDLSALSNASTLYVNLSSSDSGIYGMNTPSYFAVDDITFTVPSAVPEPSGLALVAAGLGIVGSMARSRRIGAMRDPR